MYSDALDSLSDGMVPVPQTELEQINETIPNLGASLNHLPYSRLRSSRFHRFGPLRGYLKAKSFDNLSGWGSLEWRPLVSFYDHRCIFLFSMMSRF